MNYNINGPYFNVMKDMYTEVLFSVKLGKGITDFFHFKVGVNQGCILTSTLFSLYSNDKSTDRSHTWCQGWQNYTDLSDGAIWC